MKSLGIIPARAGSKRVPGKNLRNLGGKPLVRWALDAARSASSLSTVVVSSDDEEVLTLARQLDPLLALRRPPELATDTSPAIDCVVHALSALEARAEGPFDIVVIIQPSSPFTLPLDIDETVKLLMTSSADSAVSVVRVPHDLNPVKFKRMAGTMLVPYLEDEAGRFAAHEMPYVYVRNCSVYATRRNVIESGKIIGDVCLGYEMPRERSIDINDEHDLELAAFLLDRMRIEPEDK